MSRRFPSVQMVTLDAWREPVRAGYVMLGLYGGICTCGHFTTFERRVAVVECPRCQKRFTTEETQNPWLASRQRTTTTPSPRQRNYGRPSPQRCESTPSAPRPTATRRPSKGRITMSESTPPGNPPPADEEEAVQHHEEEEPAEDEEE